MRYDVTLWSHLPLAEHIPRMIHVIWYINLWNNIVLHWATGLQLWGLVSNLILIITCETYCNKTEKWPTKSEGNVREFGLFRHQCAEAFYKITLEAKTCYLYKSHTFQVGPSCYRCYIYLNSLWTNDTICYHRSGPTLAQIMAFCLVSPSQYLNLCWLLIRFCSIHLRVISHRASIFYTIKHLI